MKKGKIIGIGGIFFQSEDPQNLKTWYETQLGLKTDPYGALFTSRKLTKPSELAYLQWSLMKKNDPMFFGVDTPFMVNYRVENLAELAAELSEKKVKILDEIAQYDYGKFLHVLDPEGNIMQLWEPVDEVFTGEYDQNANFE